MKKLLYLFPVVLVCSCAAPPPKPTVMKAPPEKITYLTGEWREIKNQRRPLRRKKIWLFRGSTVTIDDGEEVYSGTFALNEEADPKEIDFHFEGHPVNRGIYSIDGNVLMIKVIDTATSRAKDLKLEDGYTLITCRREKEIKK